jgi:RNA recognition motif-containing protein
VCHCFVKQLFIRIVGHFQYENWNEEDTSLHLILENFFFKLDYKVDEKKLKEVFRLAGKVVSAELSLDKEGKSRGFGVVEYEHPVEAVQAICILHNIKILL